MRIDLKTLLLEYGCPSLDMVHEGIITECPLSFLQIRDQLFRIGTILHEDTDNQVYVTTIRSGFGNMNRAVVAMQLRGNKLMVAGYAKEGIVKQSIWEGAFKKLKGVAQKTVVTKPKRYTTTFIAICAVIGILILLGCGLFTGEVFKTMEATKKYNNAIEGFNAAAVEYNNAVTLTSVDNISGLPTIIDALSTEDESFWGNVRVVIGQNDKSKINADTQTVTEMTNQVISATKVVQQITSPNGDWVSARLSKVPGITGVQAVTTELDPDGLLGKEGGFSACIYFSFNKINPDEIPGNSIVEKGTDCGGAVEVYPSIEDAKARCEYLAGFDGTVLYSGSYAIVGTMVVRTSYKLSNEEQFDLTSAITSSLTALN